MLDYPYASSLQGTEFEGSIKMKVVSGSVLGRETRISYFRNFRNFCRMLPELSRQDLHSSPTSGFSFLLVTEGALTGASKGKQISPKTVARRLRGGGLYARRPVACVLVTRQHRTARLQWCREHHNWTEQDWACVLFSDESRFSLSSGCRRQLIWRESGTAYRPENIQEKDRYPTCSIRLWAGIMINGRTRLHVVANGTMTGQRYIDEVLLPHVRLFRGAVGDKFVFMDDNATCLRTLTVQDCLDIEGFQRLVWPARSSDLNPIENVWDALGRQIAGRNYPPTNKNTLIRALTEEWDKLSQQLLDNVVQKVWYDVWNVASHSTVDISRIDTFL
ncbi:transposable element Tcb2 transposase [Trichonephila clavipes]|nr:transposable element Tcb2 transposase [Trichonephila clavipes]